jgi:hypothetical protein
MHCIRFTAPGDRPEFTQVPVFLWGEGCNYDSMGDSKPLASCKWTWLYLCNREKPSEKLEIITERTSPIILTGYANFFSNLIMRSYSEDFTLAARTAFYLATFTGGQVALKPDDPFSSPDILLPHLGQDFDPSAALARAQASSFARSSKDTPYPNLTS